MRRPALFAVLLLAAAGCSRRAADNYRHCLKLRVGMARADMLKIMGDPEETTPYVEGKSLPHLKGRTAYEWSNPTTMPGPDHVSVDDASGRLESIRCSNAEINATVYVEPAAPATPSVPAAPAAPRVAPPAAAPPGKFADALAAYKKKDLMGALKIANPLAGDGDASAEFLLGLIFFTAESAGMKKNAPEAMRWFYQASRQKNCEAEAFYADDLRGRATTETLEREMNWATQMDCPAVKVALADAMLAGRPTAENAAEAEKILLAACEAGSAQAQLRLGRRREAAKDLVPAYRWTLAASRHALVDSFDDPLNAASNKWLPENKAEAEKRLQELGAAMTPAEVAQAKNLVGR